MTVKISITTECGAKCKTCPVWQKKKETMSVDTFRLLWARVNSWPGISKIFINSTGDVNSLPNKREYFNIIEKLQGPPVSITMNGRGFDYVPRVDTLIFSFNGSNKDNYEHTTGLDFEETVRNIKSKYQEIRERTKYREVNYLVWRENAGGESEFLDLWRDFPGILRIGYKCENQFGEYFGAVPGMEDEERIPCDYLEGITIAPNCQVIRCAHDFDFSTSWGNALEDPIGKILANPDRIKLIEAHNQGDYPGLCESCNYNVSTAGKFFYTKGAE